MAEFVSEIKLKILDLDDFTRLVAAIGVWADDASKRDDLTPAETELFKAAVDLEKAAKGWPRP